MTANEQTQQGNSHLKGGSEWKGNKLRIYVTVIANLLELSIIQTATMRRLTQFTTTDLEHQVTPPEEICLNLHCVLAENLVRHVV